MTSRWDYIPSATYAASCHSRPLAGGGDSRKGSAPLRSNRDDCPGEASSLQREHPQNRQRYRCAQRAPGSTQLRS